jgi:hypothetical protein
VQVTTAEILWALKVVESNFTFASCDNVGQLFQIMFDGESKISKDFTCGATKVSYLITHGVAPYFKERLLSDIKKSNRGFTVQYDETTTAQVKKQMDLVVRYWSDEHNRIIVHYLESMFFGHAEASTVKTRILQSMYANGLPLSKLLALSSDGPNVNKSITAQVNKELAECHLPTLIDIGTCSLHKVHNAFSKGLDDFGSDSEDLSVKLFYWFKHSSARREDLKIVQFSLELDEVFMLRHVPSRWLTLQPAVKRILEQWRALHSYFKHLPNTNKAVQQNGQYKEIMRLLENPKCAVQLEFIADVAVVYNNFLRRFQSEGPLVHVLYAAVNDLVRTLMLRFLTTAAVATKTGQELVDLDVREAKNWRSLKEIEIGEGTKKALSKIKK